MSIKTLIEKLSIRNKLAAAFSVILLLVVALGFAAVDRLTTLNRTVDTLTSDSMVGVDQLSGMRESLLRYRLAIARYLTSKDLSPDFDTSSEKALASLPRARCEIRADPLWRRRNRHSTAKSVTACGIISRPLVRPLRSTMRAS